MQDNEGLPTHEDLLQRGLNNEADAYQREAIALSVELKNFLESDIAKFIIEGAEDKVQDSLDKLGKVDPDDRKEIVRLQTIVRQYEHFGGSLQDILTAGELAYREYLDGLHSE